MPAYVLLAKIAIAASVIGFASWLADKKPVLAGFLVALPLVSILAILFSYLEHRDAEISITFAKSIMLGVPASYFFFLPFFFAERVWTPPHLQALCSIASRYDCLRVSGLVNDAAT